MLHHNHSKGFTWTKLFPRRVGLIAKFLVANETILPSRAFRCFFAEFGIFNYIVIFVSGLVLNAVSLETCSVAFIIPVSQCDLHFTAAQKGILGAVAPFGIICSSHLWGFLADTKGRRRVIQPTLFLAFFTTIISSFVENFYLFATLRFLNGFL